MRMIVHTWACIACIAVSWRLHAQSHQVQDFLFLPGEREQLESVYSLKIFLSFLLALENPAAAWQFMGPGHGVERHRRAFSEKSHGSSFLMNMEWLDELLNKSDCPESVPDFLPPEFRPPAKRQEDGGLASFLLQRAVQTECWYYNRDGGYIAADWLSRNANVPEEVHGLWNAGQDWHKWLLRMMTLPPMNHTVEHWCAPYTVKWDPKDMALDVMDTAEKIAKELIGNLKTINATDNDFWDKWKAQVTEDEGDKMRAELKRMEEGISLPGMGTPSDAANFDLLVALTTRQAVIATLTETHEEDEVAYRLLQEYCDENANVFKGDLDYHAADDFLFGLLRKPWKMVGEEVVEPRSVCEKVLQNRRSIALDWIQRLAQTKDVFLAVQREHLEGKFADDEFVN